MLQFPPEGRRRATVDTARSAPSSLAAPGAALVGRRLVARASEILRRRGASPDALQLIGDVASELTGGWRRDDAHLPLLRRPAGEYRLWCEDDGTFELILTVCRAEEPLRCALAYDTWSVLSCQYGRLRIHRIDVQARAAQDLAPGGSCGLEVGQAVATEALGDHSAAFLRLFGVSRALLPPPLRVDIPRRAGAGDAR